MTKHNSKPGLTGRPTLFALLIGALVLAGGIALIVTTSGSNGKSKSAGRADAALVTSPAPTSSPVAAASTSATPSQPTPTTAPPAPKKQQAAAKSKTRPAASVKPLTYTVKHGDNLTVIAKWFHLHGYGNLYDWNKSVIGKNPNLIFRGQKITISSRGMTVSN